MKTLTVVTDPVAKPRPRVSVKDGQARAFTPSTAARSEWRIRQAWIEQHGTEATEAPVRLAVTAFLPMPKGIPQKRRHTALPVKRPDCDNYAKTVLDALNGVAFADDSQVVELIVQKRYAILEPPRWRISLWEITASGAPPPLIAHGRLPEPEPVQPELLPEEQPGAAWRLLGNAEAHEQLQRGSGFTRSG